MLDGLLGLLASAMLLTGLVLATVGVYGMFRKQDIFHQLHAAGLLTGPAVILVLLASISTGRAEMITSAVLVVAFVLVTSSLSTHVIADAAWRRRELLAASTMDAAAVGGSAPRDPADRPSGAGDGHATNALRVLIAHDGSSGADVALELAAGIAWPAGSTVRLVGVREGHLPTLDARQVDPVRATERDDARALDDRLRTAAERLAGRVADVEWRRAAGDPATAIVEQARAFRADCIVTGSRGRGLQSLFLGSVAQDVIDRAPCPVLVARSSALGSVLVATDGSAASDAAIDLVGTWPIFEGVPVRVLSVATGEPSYTGRPGTEPMAGAREESEQRRTADVAAVRLIDRGRKALPAVRTGDAAAQIVAEARSADLIVIGSRGRTGLTRALLGSVARAVLLSTDRSVLVVRQDGGRGSGEP